MSADNERRARELLASAYTKAGFHGAANDAMSYDPSPHCAVTIRAIMAALDEPTGPVGGEVIEQFQGQDGIWHNFFNEKHRNNTVEDGRWPIRKLYTHPEPPVVDEAMVERCRALVALWRSAADDTRGVRQENDAQSAYDDALDACADELEGALAQPQGEGS